MSLLPVVPVLLLVIVGVWFFWPLFIDPIARTATRRGAGNNPDNLAEHLFETWSEHGGSGGAMAQSGRV